MKKIRSQKRENILARRLISSEPKSENISRERLKKIRNKLYRIQRPIHLKPFNNVWKKIKISLKGMAGYHVNFLKLHSEYFKIG